MRFLRLFGVSLFSLALTAKEPAEDVKINADNIDYYAKENRADAEGDVILEHLLKNKPLVLKASKLNAEFDAKGNLLNAIATGGVEINYDGTVLKADSCAHSFKERKTVCGGDNVYLRKEGDEIVGEKAVFDFNARVFTMSAAPGSRTRGTIAPRQPKSKG